MGLDERKQRILRAIIDDYIFTAEPVGSRTVSRKYNLGFSPATIRNEMSDLEEMGYLEQPHTSAGRIPSDKGYRFYVDCLMKANGLSDEDMNNIRNAFQKRVNELEELVEQTTKLISSVTQYTSVAIGPQILKSTIKHIQLIGIEGQKALLITVTSTGAVEHQITTIPENITEDDLNRLSNMLNHKLSGRTVGDITPRLIGEIKKEIIGYNSLLDMVINLLMNNLLNNENSPKVFLGGAANIFNLPEFKDMERAKNFLLLMEDKEILYEILSDALSQEGLVISIGSENRHQEIRDYSLITATYKLNGKMIGRIGVMGPTRMEYARVVSVLEHVSNNMTCILAKLMKND
jgi:heat-inducible transcriptional repressor